jgi:hypothetical protein
VFDDLKSSGGRLVSFLLLLDGCGSGTYLFSSPFRFKCSFSGSGSRMHGFQPSEGVRTA